MMYTSKVLLSELEGRFDPRFYNPYCIETIRKIREKGKMEGFSVEKLGDISKMRTSAFYSAIFESYSNIGIPFIRVSDVRTLSISPTDLVKIPEKIAKENLSISTLKSGDIVITKGGTVGNIAIIPKWMPECKICRDIIGLKITGKVEPEYVALYLASKYGKIQFEKIRTQQIQSHLTIKPLKNLEILVSHDIEKEIAKSISQANDLGEKALDLINDSKEYLYKSLNIEPNKFKDIKEFSIKRSDINDVLTPKYYYPKFINCIAEALNGRETKVLGQISEIKRGIEVGSKFYKKEGIPFIRTSDIVSNEIDLYPQHYLSKEIYKKNKQDLREGDIVFTKDGKIGLAGMVVKADECILSSGIAYIRVTNDAYKFYTFQVLNSIVGFYQAVQRSVTASTIPHLNLERLKEIKIPMIRTKDIEFINNRIQEAFRLKNERKILIKESLSKLYETLF